MRALRFEDNRLTLCRTARVARAEEEAVVRVTLAGICNTDLEIVRGYAGFQGTPGHEFTGTVVSSPEASQVGRRVVGEINAGCGSCDLCRSGDPRHCPERTVLGIQNRDGAFAEYLSLPPRNLLVVPETVSDTQAVFTEPLAAACAILEQVDILPDHRVAVIGDGKLGQLIARVLATTGCSLTVVGKHARKMALAEAAGARVTSVDAAAGKSGRPYDFVVEASGHPSGLELALALVRPRGTVVLKSTFHGGMHLDTWRIVVNEIRVVGSRCGRFAPALRMLASGDVVVEPLVTAEFSLEESIAAMEAARQAESLKILLRP